MTAVSGFFISWDMSSMEDFNAAEDALLLMIVWRIVSSSPLKCSVIARLCKAKTGQPEKTLAEEVSKNIAGHKAKNNHYCYSRCDFFKSKNNKHNDTDVGTYL